MGIIVEIMRGSYKSKSCVYSGVKELTITNIEGPFEPTAERPAATIVLSSAGVVIIKPDMVYAAENGVTNFDIDKGLLMFGGSYAAQSDSRWNRKVEALGGASCSAIPIHDFYETWSQYQSMD